MMMMMMMMIIIIIIIIITHLYSALRSVDTEIQRRLQHRRTILRFGDFSFSRFGFTVQRDRPTEPQNH